MSKNILLGDHEGINSCENERRTVNCSPLRASLTLDNILAEELISEKQKPRQDVLVSLENNENQDPYAEFSFEETEHQRKIRSPLKGFAFFNAETTPVSSKSTKKNTGAMRTASVNARRLRLLKQYTPEPEHNRDEGLPCPPRTSTRKLRTPRNEPPSDPAQVDSSTPHRNLRPRKRPWIQEDDIPLLALRESLQYDKQEREEKTVETTSTSKKKKNASPSTTPKSATGKKRTPKSSRRLQAPTPRALSKRKLRFSESDDEGLADWIGRLKTEQTQSSSARKDSPPLASLENIAEDNEK